MSDAYISQLNAAMPTELPEVVQTALHDPHFAITNWTAAQLPGKGIANPDGLFLLSGTGRGAAGQQAWSVVLKLLRRPAEEEEEGNIWYWKREFLAAKAGLIQRQPAPLVPVRILGYAELPDSCRVWLEHLVDASPVRWDAAHYAFAAYSIGRANAASAAEPVPADYPWLVRNHCRWWLATITGSDHTAVWDQPLAAATLGSLRPAIEALWASHERLLAALERLPQIVSHFDLSRRNLFVRPGPDGADELVAIDWGWIGYGPLGGDLFGLVGSSALLCEIDASDVDPFEAAAYDAYLAGLSAGGWSGDQRLVRLAYTAWFALWLGLVLPDGLVFWSGVPTETLQHQFGQGIDELAAHSAGLCRRAHDRAAEAFALIEALDVEVAAAASGV